MTDIWTILEWFLYGAIRWVLYWAPLVRAPHVDRDIPWQWWRYNNWFDWFHKGYADGGPDEHWLNCWFKMTVGELDRRISGLAGDLVTQAKNALRSLIGDIRSGYGSLGDWLQNVGARVGDWLPSWAVSAADGLVKLFNKLPGTIAYGWQTWDQIWESIKNDVRNWARSMYDAAKALAFGAWSWIVLTGSTLSTWWSSAHTWLDGFRADPVGRVSGWLGAAWSWLRSFAAAPVGWLLGVLGVDWTDLVAFRRGPLAFYFNLWSQGWQTLGDFVRDPRAFVLDRLERALMDRW